MNVLITGGCGYVGTKLTEAVLARTRHDVTVLDGAGQVLDRWAFPHSEAGWLMTVDRLRRQGPAR